MWTVTRAHDNCDNAVCIAVCQCAGPSPSSRQGRPSPSSLSSTSLICAYGAIARRAELLGAELLRAELWQWQPQHYLSGQWQPQHYLSGQHHLSGQWQPQHYSWRQPRQVHASSPAPPRSHWPHLPRRVVCNKRRDIYPSWTACLSR
jgi:hypothetical protein